MRRGQHETHQDREWTEIRSLSASEVEPCPELEERIVATLRERGLIRSSGARDAVRGETTSVILGSWLRTLWRPALAAAALAAVFWAGTEVGRHRATGSPAIVVGAEETSPGEGFAATQRAMDEMARETAELLAFTPGVPEKTVENLDPDTFHGPTRLVGSGYEIVRDDFWAPRDYSEDTDRPGRPPRSVVKIRFSENEGREIAR